MLTSKNPPFIAQTNQSQLSLSAVGALRQQQLLNSSKERILTNQISAQQNQLQAIQQQQAAQLALAQQNNLANSNLANLQLQQQRLNGNNSMHR